MPEANLVSVIIPSYNRAYCLPKTIASVLQQTHQDFEIIVVDDGSTDDTELALRKHFPNETRLRYIRQENRGVSAARNLGIKNARGEFIALLDSDDTWVPWKLEAQIACLKRFPTAVMVHSEMEGLDADGKVFDPQYLRSTYIGYQNFPLTEMYSDSCRLAEVLPNIPPGLRDIRVWFGDIFSHSLIGNLAHTSTVMIARGRDGAVEHYDEKLRTEETFDYHLRITQRGPVIFIDAATLRYQRGQGDHLWSPAIEKAYPPEMQHELNCRWLRIVEPQIRQADTRMRVSPRALTDKLASTYGWAAVTALWVGRYREMWRHLGKSLRIKPLQPKLLMRLVYCYALKLRRI